MLKEPSDRMITHFLAFQNIVDETFYKNKIFKEC